MKRVLLAVLMVIGLSSFFLETSGLEPVAEIATSNPLRSVLDQQVHDIVLPYLDENPRAGLCIGIIRGDSTYIYGYGRVSFANRQVPDGNTIYEIGSITKTFTSVLLADFVNKGMFKLSDPMSKYLPEFVQPLQYEGKEITLQNLATHTSGLPRLPEDFFEGNTDMDNPFKDYDSTRVYHFLNDFRLGRSPGSRYEYSNLAVGILGTIFERTTGKGYESLVVDRICSTLELNDTRIRLNEEQKKRQAQGHTTTSKALPGWDFKAMAAGGAFRSTVNDMVKYVKMNMEVSPDSLGKAMYDCHRIRFRSKEAIMGLGWHHMYVGGKEVTWHDGRTGGFTSFCGFVKKNNTGLVILSSSANHIDKVTLALLDKLTAVEQ